MLAQQSQASREEGKIAFGIGLKDIAGREAEAVVKIQEQKLFRFLLI